MTKYLYFEGACGISGDMTVASLLDLGANREKMDQAIESLHLDGFHYHIERKNSYSIAGLDFDVHLHHHDEPHEEHYHEHHEHEHGHHHEHEHHHEHRHLHDVYEIIERTQMSDKARELAKKIFLIVAEAEAKAHGVPVEEVHFHEVGAIDSIVDIISAAVLLDDLGIDKVIVTGLSEGSGTVMCQHGELPVPVPAVLNIAETHGIILRSTDNKGEMVTPTGIAIVSALNPQHSLPKSYKILKSGIGLGKRDFGHANFLRTMIIEDTADDDNVYVVESNIDDCSAEMLGLAMEKCFDAGAYDVHYEPCYMKKNRPAYILRAIVATDKLDAVEYAVLKYTTTIGLRKYPVDRICMQRQKINVKTQFGEVEVKVSTYKDIVRCQPEFESVKGLAEASGKDFQLIYNLAQNTAMKEFME
ncbi:MAG: nickel pincer cofactor biosynthesis protein LarC [Alphaproteobacteria bacterium]|nr:nickel pincer cofactor biosynthesis protein LarC [Alphaproteobacteria bacterium]